MYQPHAVSLQPTCHPQPYAQGTAATHLVLIPSYNSGAKLTHTVHEAMRYWPAIWVVIDGSTDGSDAALATTQRQNTQLRVIRRSCNGGKGAAVFDGLRAAANAGFTHVLIMDADGQHPAPSIPTFMALSRRNPEAMILGQPIFDHTAPLIRVIGRRIANTLTQWETQSRIADSLFGFRVYPLTPLLTTMNSTRRMRRFDFDNEAVVQLSWRGIPCINHPVPVKYFRKCEGGTSHFHYVRDNIVLTIMHARLMVGCLYQLFLNAAGK